MWPALVVPYAAAAVLLAVAGVPKVRDPGDLVRAVRSVGMPFGRGAVRAFAVGRGRRGGGGARSCRVRLSAGCAGA